MQDLISVIIPAYNVEPYIKKCVMSVVNQTWNNIEILIIDDGSTDNTGVLCDKLSRDYSSIKVIHQDNAGLSVARNVGIENSKGEWIAFLDSDDWVEPDMYETLLVTAKKNDTVLSSCLSRNVNLGEKPYSQNDSGIVEILSYRDMISGLLTGNKMRFEVWNKLWSRKLIGDVRFIPGQVAEDVHFDRLIFEKAKKIAHINKTLHNYLVLRPGNTNSSFKTARLCIFKEFQQWTEILVRNEQDELASIVSAIAINFAVDIFHNAAHSKQDKEVLDDLRDAFNLFYPGYKQCKVSLPIKRKAKIAAFRMSPRSVYLY